ncbi:MAG: hypothetical protein WCI88_01745 [Chloroflexota bacterium]
MNYATLHQIRSYLKLSEYEMNDDALLTNLLGISSQWIERYCDRRYDISLQDRVYTIPSDQDYLMLDADLMQLITLTNGDGTQIPSSAYRLTPANFFPKHSIYLKNVTWQYDDDGFAEDAIKVKGLWGYHTSLEKAWIISGDTIQDTQLSISTSEISVSDVNGITCDLISPRFQTGQVIQIDDEQLLIAGIDTDKNIMSIKRATNGTNAAAHAIDTTIYIYRPMENIVMATIRLAAWRYKQKDVDSNDGRTILLSGAQIIPSGIPSDIMRILPVPRRTL